MDNKEQLIKRIAEIGVVLALAAGIYLSVVFSNVGLFIMLAGFSLIVFLIIEFYLRIQHNVDKMAEKSKTETADPGVTRETIEEVLDLMELVLDHLEEMRSEKQKSVLREEETLGQKRE